MLIVQAKASPVAGTIYTLSGDKPVTKSAKIADRDIIFDAYPTKEGIDIPLKSVLNNNQFVGKEMTQIKCTNVAMYVSGTQVGKTTYELIP